MFAQAAPSWSCEASEGKDHKAAAAAPPGGRAGCPSAEAVVEGVEDATTGMRRLAGQARQARAIAGGAGVVRLGPKSYG